MIPNIANPLSTLRDDFVERWTAAGMLRVRPIAPKPDELALFHQAALDAGFRPGPEVLWGDERFPSYYSRPLDEQGQRDWKAVDHFRKLARFGEETGNYSGITEARYRAGDDLYRAHVHTIPDGPWAMTIYRHSPDVDGKPCLEGIDIDTITLP